MRAHNHLLGVLSLGLLAGLAFAFGPAGYYAITHDYLDHKFYRTILYLVGGGIGRFLPPALVIVAAIAAVTFGWARLRDRGSSMLPKLLGIAAGVAFFLGFGFRHNHSHFFEYWLVKKRIVLGVKTPEALFHWDVWRPNIMITAAALLCGFIVWWLARRAIPERGGVGRAFWRRMGHPVAAALQIAIVAAVLLGAQIVRDSGSDRPNIVMVSLDTLRADHLGCYGYFRDTSPEIDRLAAEGIRFEWAFCQAPSTERSHMSMFTSLYPTVHGVSLRHRLQDGRVTLAEYLRESGYRTAACTDAGYMRRGFGFAQGFERYEDFKMVGLARSVPRVLGWMDEWAADEPFFIFLHTYEIHSPYAPPKPWRDMFVDPEYDGGFHPGSAELTAVRRRVQADPEAGHGLSPEDVEFIKARYDGGIRFTDHWMGEFIKGLEERGLLDKTWLVVTSDHGEEFTEHGTVLHGELYHTNTHVPLIVRAPGGSPGGITIPEIVELLDLMPMFLEIADIEPVDVLEGVSLLPLINGDSGGRWNVAFSEHPGKPGWRRGITSPTLHLITSFLPGDLEVYDYRADRLEQNPIGGSYRFEEVGNLISLMDEWTKKQVAAAEAYGGPERLEVDADTESQLRSLGYIK